MSVSDLPNRTDDFAPSAEASRALARALEEARFAQHRFQVRTRIVGYHGEDFERRWRRVERIVTAHNDHAVDDARKRASGLHSRTPT
jgi:hypothetical protein